MTRAQPAVVLILGLALVVAGCSNRQIVWRGGTAQPTNQKTPDSALPVSTPSPAVTQAAATPAPATPSSATPQPGAASPAGERVEAVLAREITDTAEAKTPATEFPDDAEKIYVVVKGKYPDIQVSATFVAVNAEGMEPNTKVGETAYTVHVRTYAKEGPQWLALWLEVPLQGLSPGDYRVDMDVDKAGRGTIKQSLPFKVVPILPVAASQEQIPQISGFNIALAALGGRIVSATSQANDSNVAAANLIDGLPWIIEDEGKCRPSCGWKSLSALPPVFPQDIVFSFYQEREASIAAVVIDTTAWRFTDVRQLPRHVEVWASTTSPTDGFTRIGGARLQRRPGEHLISFPPARAKYVKVRFLSAYGEFSVHVGEVRIFEARDGRPSIVEDAPKNLASRALGGVVVRYTSAHWQGPVGWLIDGSDKQWDSSVGHLPQDLLFAFRGDQIALVDRIVLQTKGHEQRYGPDPSTWPKVISVSVSTETPFDGFQEVGQFTLTQEPREQSFPIGKRARFVKLRILQNFGGSFTSLGEVRIFEGAAPGYESILLTPEAKLATSAAAISPVDETGVAVEQEANNSPQEANPLELGRRTKGTIDPLGEHDHFKLTIPGSGTTVLTLELQGRPYIKTSLTMLDPAGQAMQHFDPGRATARRAEFSWVVKPGDYLARVTEPPASIVLIWDTSGSMGKESVENLKVAVNTYLGQVLPSERLHLIRFSGEAAIKEPVPIEVLLPEFTNDRDRLKAAVQDKFFSDGGTPFYDAVKKGIDLLGGVQGNRAIVVMTDGIDTTSELLEYPGFWQLLEDKRIRLYTIGLDEDMPIYYPYLGTSGTRFLRHASMATIARSFFARTPEELKGIYQQIADELRAPSTYYLRATVSPGLGGLSVTSSGERITSVAAPAQIELILDASGSMKLKVEGRPKINIAKDVMSQIINGLPDNAQVALRIYGHRIREGRPGDCKDSELVFPFGKIDKARMLAKVRGINALGTTPIAYTLQQVIRDFGSAPGEKLVILVTDGKEECKGNPSAVVSEMVAKGFKLRLNIVGFALAEQATKLEMERVAKLTGGKFFDANNAKALTQAIEQSLAIRYEVLDAAGTPVGGGLTGQGTINVPEGIYTVVVRAAGKPITIPNVRIAYNGFTKVVLRKEGQEVGIQVQGP